MTGVEQLTVWLFGIFCAAVAVTSVARSWASSRIEPAKAHAAAYTEQCRLVARVQGVEPLTVPLAWTDGEL